MVDLLLVISFIALFAYGYWLMARLDRFIPQKGRRPSFIGRQWDAFHGRTGMLLRHIFPSLPARQGSEVALEIAPPREA